MTCRIGVAVCLATAGVVPVLACTADPLYCDARTRCSDPDRPFCDLHGEHPASEGVPRTCIPDPGADPGQDPGDAGDGDDGGDDPDAGDAGDGGELPVSCSAHLAFVSQRDGDYEIYLSDADGSNQINLSQNPSSDDFSPRWSPDGSRIVFVREDALWTVDVGVDGDGGDPVPLTEGPFHGLPQWSPDGTRIAFQRTESAAELWVVDVSGGEPTRLSEAFSPEAAWSPDSATIAFADSGDIFTVNLDGTAPTNRTNGDTGDRAPVWSPDGTEIVFLSTGNGRTPGLWSMAPDGSSFSKLSDVVPASFAGLSPDGSRIVYVIRPGLFAADVYSMNADGSDARQLTPKGGENEDPAFSADGTRIAWTRRPGIEGSVAADVHVADADGGAGLRLTETEEPDFDAVWRPCP